MTANSCKLLTQFGNLSSDCGKLIMRMLLAHLETGFFFRPFTFKFCQMLLKLSRSVEASRLDVCHNYLVK
ncbi:hypothetical protein DEM27_28095 [Metarhizobium album]|uniref:Uncharacterized protein n=1 Tax=Metarhizobium album TaxID=2182425 RepID=A0A2U2DI10_9HYPH|nr:hypothetical protein DEM27_28095 [Rhizobium album]